MTSDKVSEKVLSVERQKLEYSLGKKRVLLDKLRPHELDQFIFEQLDSVYLREMRGFKPLHENLSRSGDVRVNINNAAMAVDSDIRNFSLRTHTLHCYRGLLTQNLVWRRHESNEETTDRNVAHEWGKTGYVFRGDESNLFLMRSPDHSRAAENVVEVRYSYDKVQNKDEYFIVRVSASLVPIPSFSKFYGKKAPDIALYLLWEVSSAHRHTLEELRNQANMMEREAVKWQRLSDSIGTTR